MSNVIKLPQSLFEKMKQCAHPNELICLLTEYNAEAAFHVSSLFDQAFHAGLKRSGEVDKVKGFIRQQDQSILNKENDHVK